MYYEYTSFLQNRKSSPSRELHRDKKIHNKVLLMSHKKRRPPKWCLQPLACTGAIGTAVPKPSAWTSSRDYCWSCLRLGWEGLSGGCIVQTITYLLIFSIYLALRRCQASLACSPPIPSFAICHCRPPSSLVLAWCHRSPPSLVVLSTARELAWPLHAPVALSTACAMTSPPPALLSHLPPTTCATTTMPLVLVTLSAACRPHDNITAYSCVLCTCNNIAATCSCQASLLSSHRLPSATTQQQCWHLLLSPPATCTTSKSASAREQVGCWVRLPQNFGLHSPARNDAAINRPCNAPTSKRVVGNDIVSMILECGMIICLKWAGRQQRRRGSCCHCIMVCWIRVGCCL